jgi:hypothetical protein
MLCQTKECAATLRPQKQTPLRCDSTSTTSRFWEPVGQVSKESLTLGGRNIGETPGTWDVPWNPAISHHLSIFLSSRYVSVATRLLMRNHILVAEVGFLHVSLVIRRLSIMARELVV